VSEMNSDLATFFLDGSEHNLLFTQNLTKGLAIIGDTFTDNNLV